MVHYLERLMRQCARIWSDNLQLPYTLCSTQAIWRLYEIRQPPTSLRTTSNFLTQPLTCLGTTSNHTSYLSQEPQAKILPV